MMKELQNYEMLSDQEKWNLLATVANLYYNADMTQNQIAERMYTSRSKVSRMLKEARRLGIVEIHINEPWERVVIAEKQLQERYHLKNVRVIQNKGLQGVVEAASYYLDSIVKKDMVVGISWGSTLYRIVKHIAMNNHKNIPITVVPIMGASNMSSPERDSMDLAKDLASAYGGRYQYVHAPLFVQNRVLRESLMEEEYVQSALRLAKGADAILTSVGSIAAKSWSQYLSNKTMEHLEAQGAVGHVAGHFYDVHGRELPTSLADRMIGISMKDLCDCRDVICVADGEEKAEALLGAIRAGIVDTVIIDDVCANRILLLDKNL